MTTFTSLVNRDIDQYKSLDAGFYTREDVVDQAKELLGKVLVTKIDGQLTSGIITETEAYKAPEDKASHAYGNRRTKRTEVMFQQGGISYVYLCYGIHCLFNLVVGKEDQPHAILIRAVEPLTGIEVMKGRRSMKEVSTRLSSGPGTMSQAMGITLNLNASSLLNSELIFLEDRGIVFEEKEIMASPRIGVDYAEEWANKPWRFHIKGNPWVSKK